jgi:cystathionine gamma-lyase / homocysteine desulfhydrase
LDPITRALHIREDDTRAHPAVTPVYQTSAFEADSPYFYSRKNNPNVAELEKVLQTLENAKHAVAVTCGMSAIFMTLEILRPGDTLVVNPYIYGCSYRLLQRISDRRGFKLVDLDFSEESNIEKIPVETKMVFFETPTNPFLKTIDIEKVSQWVKKCNPDAVIVVDNTWATPLFQHPLELGADVSLHSGTKYFSGHSDVMNGVLMTNRDDLAEEFRETRFYGGLLLSPENAWLTRRSLQTLNIRLKQQQSVCAEMREFLIQQPQVENVYYPKIDGQQLKGYAGILFFELKGEYESFKQSLNIFNTGTGMACVTSMVAQPWSGSHASMTDEEKRGINLAENLVRLSFGLENPEDLKNDLMSAFQKLQV